MTRREGGVSHSQTSAWETPDPAAHVKPGACPDMAGERGSPPSRPNVKDLSEARHTAPPTPSPPHNASVSPRRPLGSASPSDHTRPSSCCRLHPRLLRLSRFENNASACYCGSCFHAPLRDVRHSTWPKAQYATCPRPHSSARLKPPRAHAMALAILSLSSPLRPSDDSPCSLSSRLSSSLSPSFSCFSSHSLSPSPRASTSSS